MKFMAKRLFLFLLFACITTVSLTAQILEPVKWSFNQKELGNHEVELVMKAKIDEGWHLYSQTDMGNEGPLPIYFEFTSDPEKFSLEGEVDEPTPHKEWDDVFEMDVFYFEKEVTFIQKVKILSDAPCTIPVTIDGQACSKGVCVPVQHEYEFSFNQTVTASATKESLWTFFWIAFAGGLLALVTPCVFPMIPMTVSFFMHGNKSKTKARGEALFFSISIVAIYTLIGLLITLLLGPSFVNWLSTHWIPNVFFFLIFIIFAASFFGAFEITLPSWMVNKSDAKADKGGLFGAFFMALTLVLVSFSCTAPIVGTILVEAATGSMLRPVIGMLGFSTAIAIPFGFFAFFPQKLSALPKSGGWLNSIKVCLGFIELALGLKFLMVADQTYHWGLLDRHIYIALWVVIFTLMGIYLMGKIKFKHDSDVTHIGIVRLFFVIVTFSFVVYLIPGMFGSPLKMLAGYLPPQSSLNFDIADIIKTEVKRVGVVGGTAKTAEQDALCEEPKYTDFLHFQHQLEGFFDLDQAIRCAKAQNKPIFVDFTGHGCVNCREMEASVWGDPRVLGRLERDYVLVGLYVDDKKALPEDEIYVSEYDGKKKKTIGAKNADIQVKYFGSNAQPNYVLLDNNGNYSNIKEDILVPMRAYNLNIEEFIKFLDSGVAEYKKRHNIQ
ncbi:MAG: thioredoxin family protein [Bacteroidales bacterium]|jgi:thiol:disulfide interchange protein DsbD|nr:thioredoxin family protein [Bacteroidales bacterium]